MSNVVLLEAERVKRRGLPQLQNIPRDILQHWADTWSAVAQAHFDLGDHAAWQTASSRAFHLRMEAAKFA